jgi:hypothetical protein|tara:strand:+ start:126 stop:419 length:294 start_codon:yes stop_codon:yes gene_type:complete
MSWSSVTRYQAPFVSRTKGDLRGDNTFTAIHEVGASTTYEPTGSFKNQAFILHEGSNYTFTALEGGTITKGLIAGEIYPISISKIVTGGSTVVKLLK